MNLRLLALAALGAAITAPSSTWACSSCGCSLNSDWAIQGYSAGSGLHFDLRYDYFNQDQLRTGTGKFDRGSAEIPNDREIQQYTINRNLALGLDYSPNRIWGVNVQVPFVDRPHATIAPGDEEISRSRSRGISDVRVVGRYQGFEGDRELGVQFGLKLPTGRTDVTFSDGPQAGSPLDRGLQPGTGTTDALLGIYHFGLLSEKLSYFANALAQVPLDSHDNFKPGTGLNMNVGLRYEVNDVVTPQLQINARTERRESGANADVDNSGATLIHLTPGIAVQLDPRMQAYAFVQLPIYQRVNGLQLEPRYSLSIGLRWSL